MLHARLEPRCCPGNRAYKELRGPSLTRGTPRGCRSNTIHGTPLMELTAAATSTRFGTACPADSGGREQAGTHTSHFMPLPSETSRESKTGCRQHCRAGSYLLTPAAVSLPACSPHQTSAWAWFTSSSAGNGARAARPVNTRRSAEPHCGIAGSSRGGVCQVGAGPCSSLPPKYSMGPTHPTTTQKRQRRKREQKTPNKAWRIFWKA